MEERKLQIGKVQVILRHSSPVLKAVVIVLIVFSMAALTALAWVRGSIRSQVEDLRQEAAALEQENRELQEKIDALGSVQSVQDIAQEELGLVNPDTVLIQPEH